MTARLGTVLNRAVLGALALWAVSAIRPASAGDAEVGAITITHAWARATPPHAQAGAAFATIANAGTEDDQLVSAASDAATLVELHTHVMHGDVMHMQEVPAIDIPAGKTVTLAPGGMHIMLIGLKHPLRKGDHLPLTLVFKRAGTATVDVVVEAAGAMGPGMPGHGPMPGSKMP
ncbi:MAG: copper chaperone PCu(A)C [Magnetospirillum sp.]|nr:copper chaperone PCu(A)C [Magnetospirillum sp.]